MEHRLTDYFDVPNTKSGKLTREELERIKKGLMGGFADGKEEGEN